MGNYKQLGSDFMKEKKAEKTDERKAEQPARFTDDVETCPFIRFIKG